MEAATVCRVVARFGKDVEVRDPQGSVFRIALRRQFDDTVCGDQITVDAEGRVVARLQRKNQLLRRDGFQRLRTIAANIDRVWIVLAAQPETPNFMIDRFLVGVFGLPAKPGLLWNKDDCHPLADSTAGQRLLANYAGVDLPILTLSARTGSGLSQLRDLAHGAVNIMVGPSGVGKSALVQALLPEESLRIGALGHTGEGQHTTTQARWYQVNAGGSWIDSPGVRDFSPEFKTIAEVAQGFPDVLAEAGACRFRDCRHRNEPACAVLAAVRAGKLPAARLSAWHQLTDRL